MRRNQFRNIFSLATFGPAQNRAALQKLRHTSFVHIFLWAKTLPRHSRQAHRGQRLPIAQSCCGTYPKCQLCQLWNIDFVFDLAPGFGLWETSTFGCLSCEEATPCLLVSSEKMFSDATLLWIDGLVVGQLVFDLQ